jgi:hypothetical protein
MPLVRIDLRKGKQAAYREAISTVVHEALVSVGVPKDDRFQVIAEHESENFVFDQTYLDIRRSEDLVIIQITWNEGRTVDQKKALYKAIADGLATSSSSWSRSSGKTGRLATESRNTRELLANAIASAGAVRLDVHVHVVGVIGVRARTQNRREPAASGRSYGPEVRRFVCASLPFNEDPPLVGERDRHEVDRQSFGVRADPGPGDAVLGAAIITGTGFDRRDPGVQRRLAERRDNQTHIISEYRGKFAGDEWMVGQAHRPAFPCDR